MSRYLILVVAFWGIVTAHCSVHAQTTEERSDASELEETEEPNPSEVAFPPIVVEATRSGEAAAPTNPSLEEIELEIERTPGGVTLVDGNDFTRRKVSNLDEALRYAPGLSAVSVSGSNSLSLSSRGSNLDSKTYDQNGVRMLEDGLPITTADGSNHNRFISPLAVRRALVFRGASSLEYGASTLGGTVNFITPTAYDSPRLQGSVSGGSHGYFNSIGSASHVFENGLDALVAVEGRTWDGYRDHNNEERLALFGNVGYSFSDTVSTRLYFNYIDHEEELPGSLSRQEIRIDPDQANPNALLGQFAKDVESFRIANKTTFRLGVDGRLDIGLSYENQDLYHPILAADQFFPGFPGLVSVRDHNDMWATARYAAAWGETHEVVFGANYGYSEVDGEDYANVSGDRGALLTTYDQDADSIEIYASDRWAFADGWRLVYGAQAVFASRSIDSFDPLGSPTGSPDDDYTGFSPRLGIIRNVTAHSEVYASVSRLFEAPSLFELEDSAGGGTLDEMTGTSVELGARGSRGLRADGSVDWEAGIYHAWIEDEIISVESPPGSGNTVAGNVDDTVHAGFEGAVGADVALTANGVHRFAPRASLAINLFEFEDHPLFGDNDLPGAPDYLLRGELLYRHISGWYAGPTFDLIGERYADFANTYEVDDEFVLGLRGGYDTERWRAFAEIRNVLDEDYIVSTGISGTAGPAASVLYPGEPLSVYAGFEANW